MLLPVKHLAIVCVFALGTACQLQADLVVTDISGVTHEADGYSTFSTTSNDMVGMRVDVFFANGTSDTARWTASGISRSNWSMSQGPGSTFSNPFSLTNNSSSAMTRFVMHGEGSSTIFDRSVSPSTSGTANGRDLQEFTFLRFFQDIQVTYFDEVQTVGSTAVGDIFAGMEVSFTDGIAQSGGQFEFRTDTDTTVNFVRTTIPEPTTAVQMMLAFAALSFHRRKRARRDSC
ncbi:MAG: hypothetical protein AAFN77_03650 [Planctomycetota bacterium]